MPDPETTALIERLRQSNRRWKQLALSLLAGFGLALVLLTTFLWVRAERQARQEQEASQRVQSQNNLKLMTLAMQNYTDSNLGHMPAPALSDRTGKPLLSWRVAILPYLGEQALYQQFKLDEPWDGPKNSRLLSRMPKVYKCAAAPTPAGETIYRVFVGNGAAFEPGRGLRFPAEFLDGMSNTILIVEAGQSVPWTKPDELPYDPQRPLPPLGGTFTNGYNVVSAEGSVHFIPKDTPEQTLRPLITRNDGQEVFFPAP
jgi:hypothetical protein